MLSWRTRRVCHSHGVRCSATHHRAASGRRAHTTGARPRGWWSRCGRVLLSLAWCRWLVCAPGDTGAAAALAALPRLARCQSAKHCAAISTQCHVRQCRVANGPPATLGALGVPSCDGQLVPLRPASTCAEEWRLQRVWAAFRRPGGDTDTTAAYHASFTHNGSRRRQPRLSPCALLAGSTRELVECPRQRDASSFQTPRELFKIRAAKYKKERLKIETFK